MQALLATLATLAKRKHQVNEQAPISQRGKEGLTHGGARVILRESWFSGASCQFTSSCRSQVSLTAVELTAASHR
jgi:hypothetical protein